MIIIVGLGNPGLRYRHTRHNAGFEAVDRIAKNFGISIKKKDKNALVGSGNIAGQKVLLVKPLTYMNNSGEAVGALASYYGVSPEDVFVFVDDVMQDCGGIRIKRSGSAGGHNGLKSLISHLGTEGFPRVRIGVGKVPVGVDLIGHVLGHPNRADRALINEAISDMPDVAELLASGKMDEAMNKFNGKK